MATYNPTTASANTTAGNVLNAIAAAAAAANNTSAAVAPLQLESFVTAAPHFVTTTPTGAIGAAAGATAAAHQTHHHTTNTTSSSYTFVQIKREPCQVSEVTTSNNCVLPQQQSQHVGGGGIGVGGGVSSASAAHHHHQHHHQQQQQQHHHHHHQQHHHGIISASSTSKTLSSTSSTLTTLVKIEASSPKVHDMLDKAPSVAALTAAVNGSGGGGGSVATTLNGNTTNSVPVGIALARKRPQEACNSTTLSAAALPMQQTLNKDMNCFGIRVADLGGVGTGSLYFTGNGDLMNGTTAAAAAAAATAEEFALSAAAAAAAAGVQSVNRAPSTFWQYPSNALPIESVISMSPATVGLQYSREASRGQVVLLPATTALGISNFPLYTPTDPFQQAAAAAAFVWPAAAAAATALQPPPNFIFPSMSPHSTLQPQPYATSLQLFGSNYLTVPLCQHNQQQQQQQTTATHTTGAQTAHQQQLSTSSSINLSLAAALPSMTSSGGGGATTCSTSSSTSRSFLSVATATLPNATHGGCLDLQKPPKTLAPALLPAAILPAAAGVQSAASTAAQQQAQSMVLTPPTAMKIEEWNATEFMAAAAAAAAVAAKTTTATQQQHNQQLHHHHHHNQQQQHQLLGAASPMIGGASALSFEARDNKLTTTTTTTTTTNLLELQANAAQALNLVRLPTPPTSATIENAAVAAGVGCGVAPGGGGAMTPNDSAATTATALHTLFQTTTTAQQQQQPQQSALLNLSVNTMAATTTPTTLLPQMQDVNIQTDTPVCSEDENSSCPLLAMQAMKGELLYGPPTAPVATTALEAADMSQQPLELTKSLQLQQQQHAQTHAVKGAELMAATAANANECHNTPTLAAAAAAPASAANDAEQATTASATPMPEDLTGLELLSNISTSTLAKSASSGPGGLVRVKQEPIEQMDILAPPPNEQQCDIEQHVPQDAALSETLTPLPPYNCGTQMSLVTPLLTSALGGEALEAPAYVSPPTPPPPVVVEPLGGLNLLCALAEQRIQEEGHTVGSSTSTGLFPPGTPPRDDKRSLINPVATSTPSVHGANSFGFGQRQSAFCLDQSSFPSMEGIELPTTSLGLSGSMVTGEPIKRKKHKHSKSKSSASAASLSNGVAASSTSTSSRRSQHCGKKSKKKYSKEKRRHKLRSKTLSTGGAASGGELDLDEEAELKSAFSCVDASYQQRFAKWPNPQEIFDMMEKNMRMRLADINRQYRKKKRKLDEISKHKKKCSKQAAAATASSGLGGVSSTLSLVGSGAGSSANGVGGVVTNSVSPLCGSDYKFSSSNFAKSSSATSTTGAYLNPSSFVRFGECNSATQKATPHLLPFPPPPEVTGLDSVDDVHSASTSNSAHTATVSATGIYKPVRLEPSALDGAAGNVEGRGAVLRLAQKHSASDKNVGAQMIVCKERKLMSNGSSSGASGIGGGGSVTAGSNSRRSSSSAASVTEEQCNNTTANSNGGQLTLQQQQRNRELMLTNEHLYRKETRVLTDMGGLFYAGVMRPLQPPDVYAITLDGERGNKPHIMSREEILKDTILEVAPKSADCVPVGTRLCAYWSQQYRCLYPGRAIESESSEDGLSGGHHHHHHHQQQQHHHNHHNNSNHNGSNAAATASSSSTSTSASTSAATASHATASTSSQRDFVSVEFDDGDSGRIRLQNIRLLLSDYPIAEYNDNPLYSLGKQKKNANSSGNSNGGSAGGIIKCSALIDAHHHHQRESTSLAGMLEAEQHFGHINASNNNSTSNNVTNTSSVVSIGGETFEMYARRSEKKRMKSLKKKAQAAAANARVVATVAAVGEATATTITAPASTVTTATADQVNGRKHHKHKKRKKHKKHHRKAAEAAAAATAAAATVSAIVMPSNGFAVASSSFRGKREMEQEDANGNENEEYDEDDDEQDQEEGEEEEEENDIITTTAAVPTLVKMESSSSLVAPTGNAVKVKTESIEDMMEDDTTTTSNLMSEVSDELKGDDDDTATEHNNSKGSKIAAFLPDRQLWGWLGKAYRKAGVKGRARKQFYKTIKRGKETITVGDSAVFLSTGRPDRPYIGRIESMWETTASTKVVRVRWFYHPEETIGCPELKYPGALFESPHEDENDVQTISHRCEVLQFERYFAKFGADSKQYQSIYDNNDTYYLAGYYNPRLQVLKMQDDIPVADASITTTTTSETNLNLSTSTHAVAKLTKQSSVCDALQETQNQKQQQQTHTDNTKTTVTATPAAATILKSITSQNAK